jgi:uncharacterized membrane protein
LAQYARERQGRSMGFPVSVNKDIERWVAAGLIDRATAEKLSAELDSRPGRFGLGAVLGVLGAVLLGAALLSLVAANWDSFPRLMRVGFILVIIAAGYLGGAWRAGKGDAVFSGVFYLLAAIAFGGGIALVGQMYHLSGDAASAALVWCLATLFASLMLASGNLAGMAGVVGLFYLFTVSSESSWHSQNYVWIVPLLSAAVALVARLTHTRVGLHAAVWLFLAMFIYIRLDNDVEALDWFFAIGGAVMFIACAWFEPIVDRITHFARGLQFYALASSFTGLFGWQFEQWDFSVPASILLGVTVIALTIAALALKGRDHRPVRTLSYLVFAVEVLWLAYLTVGTIMGSAAFFFLIGIFVVALAFLVVRMEKRFKTARAGAAS